MNKDREISLIHTGDLYLTSDGNYETHQLLGKSNEGWHGGVKVSVQGREPEITWGAAMDSKSFAEEFSKDLDSYYRMGPEPEFHGR